MVPWSVVPWGCFFLVLMMGGEAYVPKRRSSWNGYDRFYTYPHPGKRPGVARDVMVDVVNNLGLKMLAIHNEYNENNIAISPYGALSVLIALGEGLQGDAVREIQYAAHIPNDISTIRVGLRDIHRHLKSYFIPKEGFLSGLTLNHDDVTLRPEYEEILKFYGYDISNFNNPLLPEPETTAKPATTQTLMIKPAVTTTEIAATTDALTTENVAREFGITMEPTTNEPTTTTEIFITTAQFAETTTVEPEVTSSITVVPRMEEETTTTTTESAISTEPAITTAPVTTTEPAITIAPITTTEPAFTTAPITTTEQAMISEPITTTESATTTLQVTTELLTTVPTLTTDNLFSTETEQQEATTTSLRTTRNLLSTGEETQETSTVTTITTSELAGEITTIDNNVITTVFSEEVTTKVMSTIPTDTEESGDVTTVSGLTTIQTDDTEPEVLLEETTTQANSVDSLITTTEAPGIQEELSSTLQNDIRTTSMSNTETESENIFTSLITEENTTPSTNVVTTNNPSTPEVEKTTAEQISNDLPSGETTSFSSVTESLIEPTTFRDLFTVTNTETSTLEILGSTTVTPGNTEGETTTLNSLETTSENIPTDSDNEITTEVEGFGGTFKRNVRSQKQINLIELNIVHKKRRRRSRRKARSLVDYVIARYYDDHFLRAYHGYRQTPYVPREQPAFLINGKYREHQINFMKYDTVLPFYYIPHLETLALSFPLDNTNYYLLLLLPVQNNGIDKLICDLRLNGSLRYIVENLQYRHVIATIPSFMLKGYVTLTPTFQKLGIRRVFEPRQADFSPMTSTKEIYVTNIEQAITVNIRNYVDPTALEYGRDLRQYRPVEFKADHPFIYFVMDSEIHVTLMAGKVVNPLNSRIR